MLLSLAPKRWPVGRGSGRCLMWHSPTRNFHFQNSPTQSWNFHSQTCWSLKSLSLRTFDKSLKLPNLCTFRLTKSFHWSSLMLIDSPVKILCKLSSVQLAMQLISIFWLPYIWSIFILLSPHLSSISYNWWCNGFQYFGRLIWSIFILFSAHLSSFMSNVPRTHCSTQPAAKCHAVCLFRSYTSIYLRAQIFNIRCHTVCLLSL